MNERRKFFKSTFVAGLGILSSPAFAQSCFMTPAQAEGPFYPEGDLLNSDSDLLFVKGSSTPAKGEVVYLEGRVLDQNCKPVQGAMVEIWQACFSGRYNHSNDTNSAELDSNFQYWGKSITDNRGNYKFRTIIPGTYPASNDWIRPPHIHVKVHLRGYEELTTQMYFKGNQYNKNDKILQNLSKAEQENVIIDFVEKNNKKTGIFDISLNKII